MACGVRDCTVHEQTFTERERVMHAVSFNAGVWNWITMPIHDAAAVVLRAACKTQQNQWTDQPSSAHGPNEKEISHGRVSWQTHWTYFGMGPLASSIG